MNTLKVKVSNKIILVLCMFLMTTWAQGQEAVNEFKKETIKSLANRVRSFQRSQGMRFKNQHWVKQIKNEPSKLLTGSRSVSFAEGSEEKMI